MTVQPRNRTASRVVLASAAGLLLVWVVLHAGELVATQNGGIRFVLTALFSLMILLRHKPAGTDAARGAPSTGLIVAVAVAGTFLLPAGRILRVNQFEWLGLLLVVFAGLRWSLPNRFGRDLGLALFLLYWAHPLPSQVFGPFQLAMQRWSVQGSEWLLHLFNVRVWADGLVLRTEMAVCEVPAWCSGMRTATTVFLLGLGLGLLQRLPWYGCALFTAAVVVQALFLNVLRIATVVVGTPRLAPYTSQEALHDSMSLVVILGAFLVYGELRLLQRYRQRRAERREETDYAHDRLITEHPPFWKSVIHHRSAILIGLLLVLLGVGLGYKSRPYHRMRMIGDLALALMQAERYEEAELALEVVRRFWPDDDEWRLARVRVLLARRKYEEVLAALDELPDAGPGRAVQKDVLRAYSLMGLGRLEEAGALVAALPEETRRNDPRAGMILAEMAFRSDQPDNVAEHVVTASRWRPNTPRIRMLYPYLRTYRKWDAISESDVKQPFADPAAALSAMEAYMNLNRAPILADMVLRAMQQWPADPRLLEPLFFLAIKHVHPKWEDYFAQQLRRATTTIADPAQVYPLFERCFDLRRPDLAWGLLRRVLNQAPEHPVLPLVVARYGHQWFVFRRRFLGFAAERAGETMDIGALVVAAKCIDLGPDWAWRIPFGEELLHGDREQARRSFLREAIARFARQAETAPLSVPMHYEYVWALEIEGNIPAARQALNALVANHPAEEDRARVRLSEIYEHQADWEQVYETLRGYLGSPTSDLNGLLRLCESQRQLRLGLRARYTAREIVRRFPESTRAALLLADTLSEFKAEEEALQMLSRSRRWHGRGVDVLAAQLLQTTQRFRVAEVLRKAAMLPRAMLPQPEEQRLFLPPAELALLWHRIALPSESEFRQQASLIRANLETAQSPFLRGLLARWIENFTGGGSGSADELQWWRECGRDRFEKATALNQYALLLCREQRFDAARGAARAAVEFLPEVPALWHVLISLSEGDRDVIARARDACPGDGDIWLAELVTSTRPRFTESTTRDDGAELPAEEGGAAEAQIVAWLKESLRAETPEITVSAMVRGGEYLFRIGMLEAASIVARDAAPRARSLLPAYVLAVKCALVEQDKAWALASTKKAIEASLDPPLLFFRKLVELRTEGRQIPVDSEIIEALRNLRRKEPDNPLWAEMLGYVRFKRGGWEVVEALAHMTEALEKGARSKTTYVVAAECARLLGNFERAEELLRQGLEVYAEDVALRNNLAFVLAFRPDGLAEATGLAEVLASEQPDNPEIMDTLAVIYIRGERYDIAQKIIQSVLELSPPDSAAWFRATTHQADIALQRNNPQRAIDILNELLSSAQGIDDVDVMKANDLFVKARLRKDRLAAQRTTNRVDAAGEGP